MNLKILCNMSFTLCQITIFLKVRLLFAPIFLFIIDTPLSPQSVSIQNTLFFCLKLGFNFSFGLSFLLFCKYVIVQSLCLYLYTCDLPYFCMIFCISVWPFFFFSQSVLLSSFVDFSRSDWQFRFFTYIFTSHSLHNFQHC